MNTDTAQERITTLLFYGTVLLLVYLLYLLFQPFLVPLAWAAILAALFRVPHKQMEARWGKTWAAAISTTAVTLVIIVPVALITTAFVDQARAAVSSVDVWVKSEEFARLQNLWEAAQAYTIGLVGASLGDLEDIVRQSTTGVAGAVAGQAGVLLRNLVLVIVDLAITLFAVFFFFRDGDGIMAAVRRMLPFGAEQSDRMIREARDLIEASVTAGLVVAVVQGALGGLTFALLGLDAPVFWGVIMAFFALLPIAGSWLIWGPTAVWLLLTGSVGRGITLIVVGVAIIGLADNFLRPMLLSGRTQMNGLLVFISLLGGIAAFGFLGLVLGPIVVATVIGMFDAYTKDRRVNVEVVED
jgi:predicted PurR-regulated permease PerM